MSTATAAGRDRRSEPRPPQTSHSTTLIATSLRAQLNGTSRALRNTGGRPLLVTIRGGRVLLGWDAPYNAERSCFPVDELGQSAGTVAWSPGLVRSDDAELGSGRILENAGRPFTGLRDLNEGRPCFDHLGEHWSGMVDEEVEMSTRLRCLRLRHSLKRDVRRTLAPFRSLHRDVWRALGPWTTLVPDEPLPEACEQIRVGAVDRQSNPQGGSIQGSTQLWAWYRPAARPAFEFRSGVEGVRKRPNQRTAVHRAARRRSHRESRPGGRRAGRRSSDPGWPRFRSGSDGPTRWHQGLVHG